MEPCCFPDRQIQEKHPLKNTQKNTQRIPKNQQRNRVTRLPRPKGERDPGAGVLWRVWLAAVARRVLRPELRGRNVALGQLPVPVPGCDGSLRGLSIGTRCLVGRHPGRYCCSRHGATVGPCSRGCSSGRAGARAIQKLNSGISFAWHLHLHLLAGRNSSHGLIRGLYSVQQHGTSKQPGKKPPTQEISAARNLGLGPAARRWLMSRASSWRT